MGIINEYPSLKQFIKTTPIERLKDSPFRDKTVIYDSVTIVTPCTDSQIYYLLKTFQEIRRLSAPKKGSKNEFNTNAQGFYQGCFLKLNTTDKEVLATFSVPKQACGQNVDNCTFGQMLSAFLKVEEFLNIPLTTEGVVCSLHLAATAVMKKNPLLYIHLIEPHSSYKRDGDIRDGTLAYYNTRRYCHFYDKGKEVSEKAKGRKNSIPEKFKNLNLLRFETKITKNVHGELKENVPVTLARLCEYECHEKCVEYWNEEFHKISFKNLPSRDSLIQQAHNRKLTWKPLSSLLQLIGLDQCGGSDIFISILDDLRREKIISSNQKSSILKNLRALPKKIVSDSQEDIMELTEKFEALANSFRWT